MPIYEFQCLEEHREDHFAHCVQDRGCQTFVCSSCNHTMGPVASYGKALTWFEEGKPRRIENLGHEPVVVTSYAQHRKLMKERGLELLPPKYGEKGCW